MYIFAYRAAILCNGSWGVSIGARTATLVTTPAGGLGCKLD